MAKRDEFNRMIADCQRGKIDRIDSLRDTPIAFNNQAIRQIIDCIKVISQDEITIIFKGGFERTAPLK